MHCGATSCPTSDERHFCLGRTTHSRQLYPLYSSQRCSPHSATAIPLNEHRSRGGEASYSLGTPFFSAPPLEARLRRSRTFHSSVARGRRCWPAGAGCDTSNPAVTGRVSP